MVNIGPFVSLRYLPTPLLGEGKGEGELGQAPHHYHPTVVSIYVIDIKNTYLCIKVTKASHPVLTPFCVLNPHNSHVALGLPITLAMVHMY